MRVVGRGASGKYPIHKRSPQAGPKLGSYALYD